LQVHQVELELQNEALRAAQVELLQGVAVFTHSYDGIVVCDSKAVIVDVNPAFTRITGFERDEAVGRTPALLKSGEHEDAFYAEMWCLLNEQHFWRGEIINRRKGGAVYSQALSIAAVRDGLGQVISYVGVFSDISAMKRHQAELTRVANYDPLTGLPNRRLFADRFKLAMARARRSGRPLAVCYLDLDNFKQVNDNLGHDAGDQLLLTVTHSLTQVLRAEDTVARLGGDEFALLIDLDSLHDCDVAIERVMGAINLPVVVGGVPLAVTASVGVTIYPSDDSDPDTLIRHADQAMYQAKERGCSQVQRFNPQQARDIRVAHGLRAELQQALQRDELVFHYQPKVDLRDGRVFGAEALIRWQHPERGLLPPSAFLSAVTDSDLEVKVGEWVISTALRQIEAWQAQGTNLITSVNISPNHLLMPDFPARLAEMLARHPAVDPSRLELEILETAAMSDIAMAQQTLTECRGLGVNISLDDFGTGYSSLALLRKLPLDVLKIDQSFVHDMLTDPNDLALVAGVVRLAETFHLEVIAEGVETMAHGAVLLSIGCSRCQGYGIARPMPAAEISAWMQRWSSGAEWVKLGA
jgi:diguanylate cyclase (GGDEF)-like protein/PAS domain S-box-containing protein